MFNKIEKINYALDLTNCIIKTKKCSIKKKFRLEDLNLVEINYGTSVLKNMPIRYLQEITEYIKFIYLELLKKYEKDKITYEVVRKQLMKDKAFEIRTIRED